MSKQNHHSVSVAGVVFDDRGRVLLMKRRDNGQWQAPGGVLEPGETFEEGVVREVMEETGVRVKVERLTGVYKNINAQVVALVYRCRPDRGTPSPSDEASEVNWLELEDALSRMTPAFSIRVEDALAQNLTGAASRSHDGISLV